MRRLRDFSEFKTISEFEEYLKSFNVPIEKWGTEFAKTTKHLLKEVQNKDCVLTEDGGRLVRYVEFVGIEIFYDDMKLVEEKQVFRDGRIRRRNMTSSVAEKMILGEDPLECAVRGIKEELDIDITKHQITGYRHQSSQRESKSYPGIDCVYEEHYFKCRLSDEQYNPDGYVENQKDKKTFFVWEMKTNEGIEEFKKRKARIDMEEKLNSMTPTKDIQDYFQEIKDMGYKVDILLGVFLKHKDPSQQGFQSKSLFLRSRHNRSCDVGYKVTLTSPEPSSNNKYMSVVDDMGTRRMMRSLLVECNRIKNRVSRLYPGKSVSIYPLSDMGYVTSSTSIPQRIKGISIIIRDDSLNESVGKAYDETESKLKSLVPSRDIQDYFQDLEDMGFKVHIMSGAFRLAGISGSGGYKKRIDFYLKSTFLGLMNNYRCDVGYRCHLHRKPEFKLDFTLETLSQVIKRIESKIQKLYPKNKIKIICKNTDEFGMKTEQLINCIDIIIK